mmetsp:Transcript_29365/g.64175  ORF Transcript_29365/g.64175 Transcript_29365/m.64175 type:complete len:247 (-) Transcript_29365:97-837(-)
MERSVVQGCVAHVVDLVDCRVGVEAEGCDDFLETTTSGLHEWGAATKARICLVGVGSDPHQQRSAHLEALGGCIDERCVACVVPGVNQIPVPHIVAGEQALQHLGIAVVRCEDERSIAILLRIAVDIFFGLCSRQRQLVGVSDLVQEQGGPRCGSSKEPREGWDREDALEDIEDQVDRPQQIPAQQQPRRQPYGDRDHQALLESLGVESLGRTRGPAPACRLPGPSPIEALEGLDEGHAGAGAAAQ